MSCPCTRARAPVGRRANSSVLARGDAPRRRMTSRMFTAAVGLGLAVGVGLAGCAEQAQPVAAVAGAAVAGDPL